MEVLIPETITIEDNDDSMPVLSVETKSVFVNEGGTANIIMSLSNESHQLVGITYSTTSTGESNPADGGTDFTTVDGSVDFPTRTNQSYSLTNNPSTILIPINTDSDL